MRAISPASFVVTLLMLGASQLVDAPRLHAADTLRFYNPKSKLVYYRDPAIVAQATRFEAPKPLDITAITLTLGGDAPTGDVTIRVFGQEGGLPVPILERDLIQPIRISKSHPGLERVTMKLPDPVHVDGTQFFLVVESISPGVLLLSDNQKKRPACVNGLEEFHHQFLKLRDGSWRSGVYAFAVEAVVDYTVKDAKGGFKDVTAEVGITDSLRTNASIAWADIDNDSRLDLLVDGRLYHNDADGSFEEITSQAGLTGAPRANAFIDVDNDARPDILFLGLVDTATSSSGTSLLFLNHGDGTFTSGDPAMPRLANPTSYGIADADGDGYLDVFVGQQSVRGDTLRNYLLINNRHHGFADGSSLLIGGSGSPADCRGAQWVDLDNDGHLDLFIASAHGADQLWRRQGDSGFARVDIGAAGIAGARRAGCDWADYDNDGDADLLLPASIAPRRLLASADADGKRMGARAGGSMIVENEGAPEYSLRDRGAGSAIEYVDQQSGGTWGDVNNDGLLDAVVTTGCDCRYAGLYRQRPDHRFEDATTEVGLRGVVAGPDAVWVDWDNDGRLDLATISGGKLRLYRNTGVGETGNWVELDLAGQSIGSRVTVYAGNGKYTQQVTSGRGLLMGPPARLHFGIAAATKVDSVVVVGAEGRMMLFNTIPANRISTLSADDGSELAANSDIAIHAAPNPFTSRVHFTYELSSTMDVRLEVYTVEGRAIATLVDSRQDAGAHDISWDGKDEAGNKVPQGTYIYRFSGGSIKRSGSIVLTR